MRSRTVAIVGSACAAVVVLGAPSTAGAQPLTIDHRVPPNGISTPQYPRTPLLTPPVSPIQVPAPKVSTTSDPSAGTLAGSRPAAHRSYTYYPYISPAVHNAIPVPRGVVLDAIGAIAVALPTTAGGTVTLNPNGHCIFSGAGADETYAAAHPQQWVSPPAIVVDTPVFQLHVEPRLWIPGEHPQ